MPDIKPIQFPQIDLNTVQPAYKPRPVKKNVKVEQSPLHQLFSNGIQAGSAARKATRDLNPATITSDIDRAKLLTLKFYRPGKATVTEAPRLGQIIDVKI
ncbi:MAG: hypothetical protein ACE5G1_15530 [bacterium]